MTAEKFSLEFIQFQSVGMQTLEDLKMQATPDNMEHIIELINTEKDDNPSEELFWDKHIVTKNVQTIRELKTQLERIEKEIQTIIRRQTRLGFVVSEFKEMEALKAEIKPVIQLWETIEHFDSTIEKWKNQPLILINVEAIDDACNDWIRKLGNSQRCEILKKFKGPMQFIDYILRQVDNLKKFIPLLLLLKGRGMLQSHMNKINKQFGCNIVLTETTIRLLSKMDFHEGEKLEFIRSVAELA